MADDVIVEVSRHPDFLEKVLAASVAAMTVLDHEGRIIYANEAAQGILGLTPADVAERTFNDPEWRITAIDGGPFPDEELPFVRVQRTGQAVEGVRHAIVWPDGRRRCLAINAAPLVMEGRPPMVVAGVHDITEQVDAELHLQRSGAELERLAWVSAHHLMEPTRRLLSFAGRLRHHLNEDGNGEAMAELDWMEADAERLRRLIRDMQLHISAAKPRGEIGLREPAAVIAALQPELAAAHPGRVDARVLEIAPDLPPLRIDEPRLRDLLHALLDNALGHAGAGAPPHVRIEGRAVQGGVRCRIIDNGPGIPDEYHERVFEIFERLDGNGAGTGIGLSIARRIVESLGGTIGIEPTPEGGTTVYFELPDRMTRREKNAEPAH